MSDPTQNRIQDAIQEYDNGDDFAFSELDEYGIWEDYESEFVEEDFYEFVESYESDPNES